MWWENVVALGIGLMSLAAPAPLEHHRYAVAGALIIAIVARVALAVWRHTGLPPYDEWKRQQGSGRDEISDKTA